GICKLITLRSGEILGAAILGAASGELINIFSLAIAEKIKVKSLANLVPIYPTFSEIIAKTTANWQQEMLNNNHQQKEFLEGFFLLRRDWNL
ncbi:MAG: mercuric reductase, partial [Nostocaceae cyanobacterium]|nr:mercuric reductase [Nostocaceae cyanobacterium]